MWPLRRALEHNGKFPRAHRRCSPFRNANNGDATRANDHLRVLRWHNCPLRNRELLWNFRPPPSVSTDFSDQIFDHNSISSSLFAFGAPDRWIRRLLCQCRAQVNPRHRQRR